MWLDKWWFDSLSLFFALPPNKTARKNSYEKSSEAERSVEKKKREKETAETHGLAVARGRQRPESIFKIRLSIDQQAIACLLIDA